MNNQKDINAELYDTCIAENADFDLIEQLLDKGTDWCFDEHEDDDYC